MQENYANRLDTEKLRRLQAATAPGSFYENDIEFKQIVEKLARQSADISHRAIHLIEALDEAERIKFELVQKEIELGLKETQLPFGAESPDEIPNRLLVHRPIDRTRAKSERFLEILDHYFEMENSLENPARKEAFEEAKRIAEELDALGIAPKFFATTPQRAKVWHLLEHRYHKTLHRFEIDLFVEKIRFLNLKHAAEISALKAYHHERSELFKTLDALYRKKKEDRDEEKITTVKNRLRTLPFPDIVPLLKETEKILASLTARLESIPQELTEEQRKELEKFIPVLSEFFLDQCYILSGGRGYTHPTETLQKIQKAIDEKATLGAILEELETLDPSMQHLYLLHWICETILKDTTGCRHMGCMVGKTVRIYDKHFRPTRTVLNRILEAIDVRNDIAHNGLVWHPEKIEKAVHYYREYVDTVIEEQKIPAQEYHLGKMSRPLTESQKVENHKACLKSLPKVPSYEYLEKNHPDLLREVCHAMEKAEWHSKRLPQAIRQKLLDLQQDRIETFCREQFDLSYEELKKRLLEPTRRKFPELQGEELEKQAVKRFFFCFFNPEHKNFTHTIEQIRKDLAS